MFRTLNKLACTILICLGVGVLSGVAYLAYNHREAWYIPIKDYWVVAHIDASLHQETIEYWDGRVTQVLSGDQFVMKAASGALCSIRLTGLEAPQATNRLDQISVEDAQRSQQFLSSTVMSRDVRVAVTYRPSREVRSGMGIVFLNGTNVNQAVVESGNARARLEFMKGLPRHIQLGLLKAERRARRNGSGVWTSSSSPLEVSRTAF